MVLILAWSFVLWGCLPGASPPHVVDQYVLDYAPPPPKGERLDQALGIARFSVAQTYNTTAMIHKDDPYRTVAPFYRAWRTNPGDMVTDCLVRDFRASGLFRAVFSFRSPERPRFMIEGGIEEFLETREGDKDLAVLALEATLLDNTALDVPGRVLFQKQYRAEEPCLDRSAEAFARAMSRAMEKLSARIIADVHTAVQKAAQ